MILLLQTVACPQFMDGALPRLRHRTYNAWCHHAHIPVCLSLSTHHYTHRLSPYLSLSIGTHCHIQRKLSSSQTLSLLLKTSNALGFEV